LKKQTKFDSKTILNHKPELNFYSNKQIAICKQKEEPNTPTMSWIQNCKQTIAI